MKTTKLLVMVSTAIALTLSGCVVAPGPYGEPVMVAPPPQRDEYVGPPPVLGYIWITGFWNWVDGRHVWVSGHWDVPRPEQHWVPHQWERVGNHWRLNEGHWERHGSQGVQRGNRRERH